MISLNNIQAIQIEDNTYAKVITCYLNAKIRDRSDCYTKRIKLTPFYYNNESKKDRFKKQRQAELELEKIINLFGLNVINYQNWFNKVYKSVKQMSDQKSKKRQSKSSKE